MITTTIAMIFHFDTLIPQLMTQSGLLVYAVLFLLIFVETGIVVFPFLPGDSLLFLSGSLAALSQNKLNPIILIFVLGAAAILGDALNFKIGQKFGYHLTHSSRWQRWISQKHLQQAEVFFKTKGNFAIFLGRFMPIIRTLVPFTAGGSHMSYRSFLTYNILGGISWVLLCIGSGYFFGNISFVKTNFTLIMLAIVVVSLFPLAILTIRNHILQKKSF